MTRLRLPEGVPVDNQEKSERLGYQRAGARRAVGTASLNASPNDGDYIAPDTATPQFKQFNRTDDLHAAARTVHEKREVYERIVEEDESEEEDDSPRKRSDDADLIHHGFHPSATLLILIAIGLVLVALAAFALTRNQEATPLCSELPAWNQYNCLPG